MISEVSIRSKRLYSELSAHSVALNTMIEDNVAISSEVSATTRQLDMLLIEAKQDVSSVIWLRAGTSQHIHNNLSLLSELGVDSDNELTLNGKKVYDGSKNPEIEIPTTPTGGDSFWVEDENGDLVPKSKEDGTARGVKAKRLYIPNSDGSEIIYQLYVGELGEGADTPTEGGGGTADFSQIKVYDTNGIRLGNGASDGKITIVPYPVVPTKVSAFDNDEGYLKEKDIEGKVDKVEGKGLSTEDFTTALKTKLQGLSNYDDSAINDKIDGIQDQIDTLVSGDAATAIESFNEIIAFLDGVEDTETLEGIIAAIEQQIVSKVSTETFNALATRVGTAETAIATNKTNIATNTTNISNLKNRADGLQTDIQDVQDDVAAILDDYLSKANGGTIKGAVTIQAALEMNTLYLPNSNNTPSDYTLSVGSLGSGADTPSGEGGGIGKVSIYLGTGTTPYDSDAEGKVVLPPYPTTLPASDVYDWAKAATKPTYTASEVGALSTSGGTIEGGFGALSIKRNNAYASAIRLENTSGVLGYIGFNDDYNARLWDRNQNDIGILIHSGNIKDYNAGSATKLQTARTIWGQSFDGSANVSGVLSDVNQISFDSNKSYGIFRGDWISSAMSRDDVGIYAPKIYLSKVFVGTPEVVDPYNATFQTYGKAYITASLNSENWLSDFGQIRANAYGTNYCVGVGVTSNGYAVIQGGQRDVGAIPLLLNPSGGNVLIGTTTDSGDKLQVNGSTLIKDNYIIYAANEYSNWERGLCFKVNNNLSGGVIGGGKLNELEYIRVTPNLSNSSIGLKVMPKGGMRLCTDILVSSGVENIAGLYTYSTSPFGLQICAETSTGSTYLQARREGKAEYFNIVLQPDGGNVGIGISNPAYKLDVNGTFNAATIYQNGQTLDKYYLPLSGGTISGGIGALHIYRNDEVGSFIGFSGIEGNLGYLGFRNSGRPGFFDPNWNVFDLIHSGNIGSQTVAAANSVYSPSGREVVIVNDTSAVEVFGSVAYDTYVDGKTLAFRYGSSYTPAMTINSFGNVTIGASDLAGTSAKLHIDGNLRIGKESATLSNIPYIYLWKGDGTYMHRGLLSVSEGGATFDYYNPNIYTYRILCIGPDGLTYGNDTSSNKAFTINSSGNVLIGTTTDNGYKLYVAGNISASAEIRNDTSMSTWGAYQLRFTGESCGLYQDRWISGDKANRLWLYNVHELALYGSSIELYANTWIAGNISASGYQLPTKAPSNPVEGGYYLYVGTLGTGATIS